MSSSPPVSPEPGARDVVKRTMRLPTAHRFRLVWRLSLSPKVPGRARLPLAAFLVYLAMPLDLIPDFIPVIGQLDDLLVGLAAVWWFLRVCPPDVALAEIELLEATRLGTAGRLLPWLIGAVMIALLALFVLWLVRR